MQAVSLHPWLQAGKLLPVPTFHLPAHLYAPLLPPLLPAGPKGMGAILARVPEIMLCKPTTNDRWDRRAVELVAFQHTHGHCNVPEVGAGAGALAVV